MARMAMLIDLTRCIGCDACTVACKQENGTPADVFFARVLNVEAGTYPNVKRFYIPVLCNHCENPACLKACPNKAIFRREDGIVLIDQDRCRGTGACVSSCPYGNIILTKEDKWYLPEDRAYERDHVKPRLKQNVARKCTLCAQRVDHGLEPACVVACPTTARIFGDKDDPDSKISRYVEEQKQLTEREPFQLLPECGTDPANVYLGTMATQEVSTEGGHAEPSVIPNDDRVVSKMDPAWTNGYSSNGACSATPVAEERSPVGSTLGKAITILALTLLLAGSGTSAQTVHQPSTINHQPAAQLSTLNPRLSTELTETWSNSSCSGCHGPTAMGGLGPPLAELRGTLSDYKDLPKLTKLVRSGKGMMPGSPAKEVPDKEIQDLHRFVQAAKWDETQIPISYKVGALLSVKNVGMGFGIISLIAFLLVLKVLAYWVDCSGIRQIQPYLRQFGYLRALGVALWSFLVDGLLVASVWRKDKFRWAMHGLLIYGFLGLGLADFLINTLNPTRQTLPMYHWLKILPNLSGMAVLAGLIYVQYRYSKDEYIDNGLTLGRDYLFLNLLGITILSGFIVQILRYNGAILWVLPTYVLHLATVATLMISAPFTRFAHAFVVPVMVALTRVTEEVAKSGKDLGFVYEPSPGRHHKSERIAAGVLKNIDPEFAGKVRIRYYP